MKIFNKLYVMLMTGVLMAALLGMAAAWYTERREDRAISCTADFTYATAKPAPATTTQQQLIIYLSSQRGDGIGSFSLTAQVQHEDKTYIIRREVVVRYEVLGRDNYFFHTLSIDKRADDNIPADIENQVVAKFASSVEGVNRFTIRKSSYGGYFFYQSDIPLFYCSPSNR